MQSIKSASALMGMSVKPGLVKQVKQLFCLSAAVSAMALFAAPVHADGWKLSINDLEPGAVTYPSTTVEPGSTSGTRSAGGILQFDPNHVTALTSAVAVTLAGGSGGPYVADVKASAMGHLYYDGDIRYTTGFTVTGQSSSIGSASALSTYSPSTTAYAGTSPSHYVSVPTGSNSSFVIVDITPTTTTPEYYNGVLQGSSTVTEVSAYVGGSYDNGTSSSSAMADVYVNSYTLSVTKAGYERGYGNGGGWRFGAGASSHAEASGNAFSFAVSSAIATCSVQ